MFFSVRIYGFVNTLVSNFCCHLSWKITRNSGNSPGSVLEIYLQIPLATLNTQDKRSPSASPFPICRDGYKCRRRLIKFKKTKKTHLTQCSSKTNGTWYHQSQFTQ